MTAPKIVRSLSTTYSGLFRLRQLRQLVEAANDLGDEATVTVRSYNDQREGSSVSFSIQETER